MDRIQREDSRGGEGRSQTHGDWWMPDPSMDPGPMGIGGGGDPAPSRPRWDQPAKGKAGCGSGRRDEIFVGRSWCWSPVRPSTPHQKDTAHGDRSHGSLFCLYHTSKGGRRSLTWNGRIRMHRRWQGGANQGRGPLAMSKGRTTSWTRWEGVEDGSVRTRGLDSHATDAFDRTDDLGVSERSQSIQPSTCGPRCRRMRTFPST